MADIVLNKGPHKDYCDEYPNEWIEEVVIVLFSNVKCIALGKKYFNVVNRRFKCNRQETGNASNNNR